MPMNLLSSNLGMGGVGIPLGLGGVGMNMGSVGHVNMSGVNMSAMPLVSGYNIGIPGMSNVLPVGMVNNMGIVPGLVGVGVNMMNSNPNAAAGGFHPTTTMTANATSSAGSAGSAGSTPSQKAATTTTTPTNLEKPSLSPTANNRSIAARLNGTSSEPNKPLTPARPNSTSSSKSGSAGTAASTGSTKLKPGESSSSKGSASNKPPSSSGSQKEGRSLGPSSSGLENAGSNNQGS